MNQSIKDRYRTRSRIRLENRIKRLLAEFSAAGDFQKKSELLLEIIQDTPRGNYYRTRLLTGVKAQLRQEVNELITKICLELLEDYSPLHQPSLFSPAGVSA